MYTNLKSNLFACTLAIVFLCSCSGGSTGPSSPPAQAQLNQNAFNFIFIQNSEMNSQTGNLSVTGFNHSIALGNLLNGITLNKVDGIYTMDPFAIEVNSYPDITPIQTVENYALLNSYGIASNLPNEASYVENIILNILQKSSDGKIRDGNYIFSLPQPLINEVLKDLSIYENYNLSYTFTPLTRQDQYTVLSFVGFNEISQKVYNDGINPSSTYPNLHLTGGASCLQNSVTVKNTVPPPNNINKNETVYLIRHVEAHPASEGEDNRFNNGNYVCQGQWRAIGGVDLLLEKIGGSLPDYVYAPDPSQYFSKDPDAFFDFVRPALSVEPFTIKNNMPLNLINESQFSYKDADKLAEFLYTGGTFDNKVVLVDWSHSNIVKSVKYLFTDIYNDESAAESLPEWPAEDSDGIWKLQFDAEGNVTFTNSCIGIDSSQLPMACPLQ